MNNKFRILSLDGGGIRGVITAVWLWDLEKKLGGAIRDHFDLLAGTSTGSILACGVAKGLSAQDILNMYVNHGGEVFPGTAKRLWSRLGRLVTEGPSAPKYNGEGLESVLRKTFGDALFGDLPVKTMVVTYDTFSRSPNVLKTTKEEHKRLPVWEVCKASCSAPAYFPGHGMKIGDVIVPLIDGGVVANNPTACAIAEGVRMCGREEGSEAVSLGNFVVASFGTGESTRPIELDDIQEWGALEWAFPIIEVLLDGSTDAVDYIARFLLGENRYFRFQTKLDKAYDDMDDASATNINALRLVANDYLRKEGGAKMDQLKAALT